MQNRIFAIMITALLVLMISGSAMCATYDSSVMLVEKENFTSTWDVVDGGASATVEYNSSGDEFVWRAAGTVPNFNIEQGCFCYALIYYADKDDRYVNWGGDNPGALLGEFAVDVCDGTFDTGDCVTELDINMPEIPDYNIDPDPWDEYCNEETDNFEQCCGAKLWIVPCSDYDEPGMAAWNPADYLFETNFIWYDNTDHNVPPEVVETTVDIACVSAGDNVVIGAIVEDMDGYNDLENMVVTANMGVYGVDDIVVLDYVGMLDCIRANYSASVLVTTSTVDRCRGHQTRFDIRAEDSSGANCILDAYLDVEPGECAYMNLENYYYPEEELMTVALTHLWSCETSCWWWCSEDFSIYRLDYSVHLYDEYGNYIGPVNDHHNCYNGNGHNDCCNGFTVTFGEGSSASMEYCSYPWWHRNLITVTNEEAPGVSVMTVHCIDGNIPDLVHEIEFLQPVDLLEVTSNAAAIYETDSCSKDELINISAQIIGPDNNPISMPRVDVTLYIDNVEYGTHSTDENGTVEFINVSVHGYTAGSTVTFRAEAECREGTLELDVVEPVLTTIVIDDVLYMSAGGYELMNYTCYNPNGGNMVCPDCVPIWSCNEFGEINETTGNFTAIDCGLCVVTVDVSGITDTEEFGIICNWNCTNAVANESFVLTSGSVSLTGNFTDDCELVCLQATWFPVLGFDNITRIVSVDTCESVTLNLSGEGDTWMQNETTGNWSKYADGNTAEVSSGMYALVTPGVAVCTDVTISPAGPFDIYVGNTIPFTVSCVDQYGDGIECLDLTWVSDNDTVGEIYSAQFEAYVPGVANVTATGCGVSNSVQVNVTVEPEPDPEPTPTATRRRSSGGGGGLYYYDSGDTGSSDDDDGNETDGDSSGNETVVEKPTPVETPTVEETPEVVTEDIPEDKPKSNWGYVAVLTIAGILLVAYLMRRGKGGE